MSHRPRASVAVVGLAALLGTGLIAAATPAARATSPAASPTEAVTVFLRAPRPAALNRLAAAQGLTHHQRATRLAALVPGGAAHDAVSRALRADGMFVSGQTAWSMTARGPASVVSTVFGVRPAAPARATPAQLRAATGPLPLVPAALLHLVTAAFPTTGGPAVFHHSTARALTGPDFRDAYTSPHGKTAGGRDDGKSTIATLQLAGYAASDLTAYAEKEKLPKIVGTSKYHAVTVDGGPTASDNQSGGDVEVDLDQESILSTAPSAAQRPYFAPNTNAGYDDVLANVFDDVVQNRHQNGHGDPHITALSTSWGGCESGDGATTIATAQTLIKALVAAGVTVFASSGDDGIYDCGASVLGLGGAGADVDYPASSPQVVGVGGTNLQHTGARAARNNGRNWHEIAWSCSDANSCASALNSVLPVLPGGTGGTGGGESGEAATGGADSFHGFAEPAYQRTAVRSGAFADQKHRMVPDIAADGDPATGFDLYTSDRSYSGDENSRGLVEVGGTSLSSPVSAALFTNALAAAGRHTGIGDIHHGLYTAYRKKAHVFRDVTKGSNGSASDRGSDPSVSARRGYDTVSGLGGVFWPALLRFMLAKAKHHTH